MIKKGSAVWKGSLKEGTGSISTETGVLKNAPYGFKARFEDGPGTNPEELIAAAHAACYSDGAVGGSRQGRIHGGFHRDQRGGAARESR